MGEVLGTIFQTQDLDGGLWNIGDAEARDRIDNVYTKDESDELFRPRSDSYSSETIDELLYTKADKNLVYSKDDTDEIIAGVYADVRATFANIRATVADLDSRTTIHFQNIDDQLDNLGDTYYNKDEVNAIAEELDLTKQNKLVSDGTIVLTPNPDGTVEIGTLAGESIIDDGIPQADRVWSSSKVNSEFEDALELMHMFLPVATVFPYTGNIVPDPQYWLMCDGREVSRIDYAALYAAIGTMYGAGDGSTTFNLPDMRGRTIMGVAAGGTLGEVQSDMFGEHTHSADQAAHSHGITDPGHNHTQKAHNHGISDPGHSHTMNQYGWSYQSNHAIGGSGYDTPGTGYSKGMTSSTTGVTVNNKTAENNPSTTGISIDSAQPAITVQNAGGTETRPKNIRMNWIIKCV